MSARRRVSIVKNSPGPSPRHSTVDCLYLYGIHAESSELRIRLQATLGDGIRQIQRGRWWAIVENVERAAFSDANLSAPEWLLPRIRLHDEVLRCAMEFTTVLPSRFATLFSSTEALTDWMDRHQDTLRGSLRQVKDHEEWGIEIQGHARPANGSARGFPASPDGLGAGSVGLAFLQAKKAQDEARAMARETTHTLAMKVFDQLACTASASHRVIGTTLKASFLVPRIRRRLFRSTFDRLTRKPLFEGLECRLSGPWPPYHFCDAEGKEAHRE